MLFTDTTSKHFYPQLKKEVHNLYSYMNPIFHYNNYVLISKWELGLLSRYSNGPWAGWPGFDFWHFKIFLFSTMSKLVSGPNQPPIQWVPRLFPWGEVATV
jgi:hypothetical protein